VARLPAREAEAEKDRIWLRSGVMGFAIVVVVLLNDDRTGRTGGIEEKREEYVRGGEVEESIHDVVRICGLVGEVSLRLVIVCREYIGK
jgi:hypothetical protein